MDKGAVEVRETTRNLIISTHIETKVYLMICPWTTLNFSQDSTKEMIIKVREVKVILVVVAKGNPITFRGEGDQR